MKAAMDCGATKEEVFEVMMLALPGVGNPAILNGGQCPQEFREKIGRKGMGIQYGSERGHHEESNGTQARDR